MDGDDDAQMLDIEPPKTLFKGKGKAVEQDIPAESDNLPWYACPTFQSPISKDIG